MQSTKVKYVGTAKEVDLAGVGLINPGDIIDVSEALGKQLLGRPDFEEVKPKKVKKRRKRRPVLLRTLNMAIDSQASFSIKGGE